MLGDCLDSTRSLDPLERVEAKYLYVGNGSSTLYIRGLPSNLEMATTRLRKTFQYPADNSDDDDTPADLDEEGTSMLAFVWDGTTLRGIARTGEAHTAVQERRRGSQ